MISYKNRHINTNQVKQYHRIIPSIMIADDCPREEFEIEKIQRKMTKKNGNIYYLVKWCGYSERQWLRLQELSNANQAIQRFEKKLKFKKQLKFYASRKKSLNQEQNNTVIVIDSEEQAKKIITISSDSQESDKQAPHEKPLEKTSVERVQSQNREEVVITAVDQIIEDMIPQAPPQQIIQVPRYNYLRGEWQMVNRQKKQLISTALIRQVLDQYQQRLPKINILRAVIAGDKRMIQFQCKQKKYQIHYDVMRRYRPTELLQFYEKKSSLYHRKQYHFTI